MRGYFFIYSSSTQQQVKKPSSASAFEPPALSLAPELPRASRVYPQPPTYSPQPHQEKNWRFHPRATRPSTSRSALAAGARCDERAWRDTPETQTGSEHQTRATCVVTFISGSYAPVTTARCPIPKPHPRSALARATVATGAHSGATEDVDEDRDGGPKGRAGASEHRTPFRRGAGTSFATDESRSQMLRGQRSDAQAKQRQEKRRPSPRTHPRCPPALTDSSAAPSPRAAPASEPRRRRRAVARPRCSSLLLAWP